MKKILLTLLPTILTLSVWAQSNLIENHQALKNLRLDTTIQLIDVRTAEEFKDKHIHKAINIDWRDQQNFEQKIQRLDRSKPVYVYCLSGGRSKQATQKIQDMGYKVYDIQGGIAQWESNDLPLERLNTSKTGLTLTEYQNTIKKYPLVLVNFYAPWCGPCQNLEPIIERIKSKHAETLKVIRINVDENMDLYKSLNIKGIPMLYIYKDGIMTWSQQGLVDQKTIEEKL